MNNEIKRHAQIAFISACALFAQAQLVFASDDLNRPEYKLARGIVLDKVHCIYQKIHDGANIQQLSPKEISVLRGDLTTLLPNSPTPVLDAAKDAAGLGLDASLHVLIDNSDGIVTAFRWDGIRWQRADFNDPQHRGAAYAFVHARKHPCGDCLQDK